MSQVKIGFYGPRNLTDYDSYLISTVVTDIIRDIKPKVPVFYITSSNGIEVYIQEFAKEHDIKVDVTAINWSKYAKAGPKHASIEMASKVDELHMFQRKDLRVPPEIITQVEKVGTKLCYHDINEVDDAASAISESAVATVGNVAALLQSIMAPGVVCTPLRDSYSSVRSTPTEIFYDKDILMFSEVNTLLQLERLMKKKWRGSTLIAPGVSPAAFVLMITGCEGFSVTPQTVQIFDPIDLSKMWRFITVARSSNLYGLGPFFTETMRGRDISGYLSIAQPGSAISESGTTVLSMCDEPALVYKARKPTATVSAMRFKSVDGPLMQVTEMSFIAERLALRSLAGLK